MTATQEPLASVSATDLPPTAAGATAAALSSNHQEPSHSGPVEQPATLTDTHWRITSVAAQGKTLAIDDEQAYLVLDHPNLNSFVLREHCQNVSGGLERLRVDQLRLYVDAKGTGVCQATPLAALLTQVLRSPLTVRLAGQSLTLAGATGSMSLRAEPATDATRATSRVWQLTRIQDTTGTLELSHYPPGQPGMLLLDWGNGFYLAHDYCKAIQATTAFTGDTVDLVALPVSDLAPCPTGTPYARVARAFAALGRDGHITWRVSGSTLTLKGASATLSFRDAGAAPPG